jgi:hypothetical protein
VYYSHTLGMQEILLCQNHSVVIIRFSGDGSNLLLGTEAPLRLQPFLMPSARAAANGLFTRLRMGRDNVRLQKRDSSVAAEMSS